MTDRSAAEFVRLAVITPAYQEESGIEQTCKAILSEMASVDEFNSLVVVDDGSTDSTATRVEAIADAEPRVHLVRRELNGGYGAALRSGADCAYELGATHAVFIDSDLTNPPAEIKLFLGRFSAGARYVKASRFIPGGGMEGVPAWRAALSRIASWVAQALFGTSMRDVTNGFRGVELSLYRDWDLHEEGFAVIMEEMGIVVTTGVEAAEFPSRLGARRPELRATSFTVGPGLILDYIKFPLHVFRKRVFGSFRRLSDLSVPLRKGKQ